MNIYELLKKNYYVVLFTIPNNIYDNDNDDDDGDDDDDDGEKCPILQIME